MNIIEKYLNTKEKKITAGVVAGVVVVGAIAGTVYATRDTSPALELKKDTIKVEYGQTYKPSFEDLVKTKGLDKDDVKYLSKNTKIKSNIKNEKEDVTDEAGNILSKKDKGYPAVGKYKVTVKYKDETKTVKVSVKDTTAPELTVPENTEVVKGTDLATFDFKSLMSASDLAKLNDIQIDYSGVDVNNAGEYTAKASVEDVNKNKTEKEFKVTVKEPVNDANTETTTEVQTDPTTGKKKTVVVTKPKSSASSNSNTTSSSTTNRSNGTTSSTNRNNTSSGSTSRPSSGGSTGGNTSKPSTGGSTSKPSQPSQPSQPQKHLVTIYWYECYDCHKKVTSTVSDQDAKNKLNNTPCTDFWEGKGHRHPSGHSGYYQEWQ